MKVSGKPQVTGNSKGSGQSAAVNNVYLTSGKIITIGTGSGLNLAFLQKGAAFGVNTQAVPASGSPAAVTDENSKDYSEFFSSDNSSYSVINDGSDAAQVVKLGLHTHSWTYTLSEDKTSITASCGAAGQCSANDTTLTIQAPEDLVYDGSNKEANFGTATSFCGGALPNISYQYKFAESQNYADTTDTSLPGYYKASFTVGSGADAKTASIEFQLSRKQLTVSGTTVQSKTYDGTIAATVSNNGSLSGIVEGDTVSIYGVSAVFADKNVGTNKTVNVIYELQGTDAENYLAPEEGSVKADITGKQLTVTQVIMYGKTYDGTTATTAKVNSFSGVVGNDDVKVTVSSATFDNKNVDSFKKITVVYALTGDDAGNYLAPANGGGFGNIIAKAINVAADNKSSYVGSSLESLSYVADDLCSGDSWTGALSCDADNSVVDEYDILQGTLNVSDGNSGKNYAITFTPGTYTVSDKVVQSLSFQGVSDGAVSKTYGDAAFTQAVSGAQTTVTYSSTNTEVATVDSSTGEVTILKAGSTVIKASAVETAMYEAAEAQYNLTVAKVKLAVPQAATDLVYNGQQQTGVSPVTDAPYEVSGNTATNAGDYTATFSLNNTDNYEWDLSPVSTDDQDVDWSIAHKPVTVTAEDKSITLGDALPVLSAKVEGLIGSDSIDYSFKAIDVTAVGVYSISPCGTAKQGNYELVFTDGTLTVNSTAQDAPLVDTKALKDILAKYAADPAYAGKKLDVILRTDGDVNADAQTRILAKAGSAKALFFNANLFLIVTEDGQEPTSTNIGSDNSTLISVTYKFDFTGKKDIQVLREHEGQIEVLGTQENAAGEYVVFDKDAGTVTVTACKYSVYAIAYNDASADSNTPATGDAAPLALVALACIAAGACTLFARRRMQH